LTQEEEQAMAPMIEFPLDLPDVRVLKTEFSEHGDLIVTVESTLGSAKCRRCGKETREFHGYDTPIRLRHLPVLNRRVYIELRPKRYRCSKCEGSPTTTQRCSWYDPRSAHTRAFEQSMMLALVGSTLEDVARKNALGTDALEGMLERHLCAETSWSEFEHLGLVGIDEIALKKGHRHYVTILSTRMQDGRVELLGVLADRKKDTVLSFLRSIPEALRATVDTVCIDMHQNYADAVREVFPNAQIVVDRFHVAKAYRDGADTLRKHELQRLKKELPKDEYKRLHGSMWAFRKRPEQLDPEEKEVLGRLFEHAPALKTAHELREELTNIFETAQDKPAGKQALEQWQQKVRRSGLSCFERFLTTLSNWMEEITNYFLAFESSGFIEGLNNKIKVLKRRCYGIFNVTHLFRRIFLDLNGYALFGT
jgi:transposase